MKAMTSRERGQAVFALDIPDRVPINFLTNPGLRSRLEKRFHLPPDDEFGLADALGVDLFHVWPEYAGPALHEPIPERQVDEWGRRRRWIANESGGYWDYCDFPLQEADPDVLEAWPMPDPDDYDYDACAARCERKPDGFWFLGHPGVGDLMNTSGMLMGVEDVMLRMGEEDEALQRFWKRRTAVQEGILERAMDRLGDRIGAVWIGEDLGSQTGPLISLDMYRSLIRPLHQKIVDCAASRNLPIMIHSCGSSRWAFEDFIEMGIRAVDTLQPEAAGMEPAILKRTYGGRLVFHGCISTAGPVADGSAEETREECRRILDIMMPGGGYCFAPTHLLQDNSPTENVIAMYETARQAGSYDR
jgi:uroporphyrinogen decarboxylase